MKYTERYAVLFAVILSLVIIYGVYFTPKETPELDNFPLYSVNYTGLPSNEDVKVYPLSHIIYNDSFKIVFENNRDTRLFWGQAWEAEKWVQGEWEPVHIDWAGGRYY